MLRKQTSDLTCRRYPFSLCFTHLIETNQSGKVANTNKNIKKTTTQMCQWAGVLPRVLVLYCDVEIFTWCSSGGWLRSAAFQQLAAAARLSLSPHTASPAAPLDTLLRLPSAFKNAAVTQGCQRDHSRSYTPCTLCYFFFYANGD